MNRMHTTYVKVFLCLSLADSACSATAYLCGVKANSGTAGVTVDVKRYDCVAQQNKANHVSSILAWAQVKDLVNTFSKP